MNGNRHKNGRIWAGWLLLIVASVAALALSPARASASTDEIYVSAPLPASPGIDFGDVPVAEASAAEPLTVTNLGAQELEIDSSALDGADAADFEIVSDGCAEEALAFEETCQVLLRATPSAAGALSASLEIVDNAPASPHVFPLTATGVEAKRAERGTARSGEASAGSRSPLAAEIGPRAAGPSPTIRGLGAPLKPRASGWVAVAVVDCPALAAEACEMTSARASLRTGARSTPVAVRTPHWIQPGSTATVALMVPLTLAESLSKARHGRPTIKVGLRAVAPGGAGVERSLRRVLIP
jgi:hypothetical protein